MAATAIGHEADAHEAQDHHGPGRGLGHRGNGRHRAFFAFVSGPHNNWPGKAVPVIFGETKEIERC